MLFNFKNFIAETQDRVPKYMKHTRVRIQNAAWEKYLLHM